MAGCLLGELDFTFLIDACLRHQNQVVCLCSLVNLPSIRACQGNLFSGSGMEGTGSSSCVVFRCQRLDVGSCLIAVYSNDTILAACAKAGVAPKIAHTPSVIGTILRYVEAGSGIGIVPESVAPETVDVRLVPLEPAETIPLVMVWSREGDDPAVSAFRDIVVEWLEGEKRS